MNREERIFLSNQFRQYCSNLPTEVRNSLEQTLLTTFSVQNIRNVQLWTREGTQTRNFIPTNNSTTEFYLRVQFAQALLNQSPIAMPVKQARLMGESVVKGQKLREYLADPYMSGFDLTGGSLFNIKLGTSGEIFIIYASYPDFEEEVIEPSAEDSIWDDLEFDNNSIFED